jgi:hypothetical protein
MFVLAFCVAATVTYGVVPLIGSISNQLVEGLKILYLLKTVIDSPRPNGE